MIDWQPTRTPPALQPTDLHLWRLPTTTPVDAADWLSAGEHARLAAMTDMTARQRLLTTRAGLRQVLAGYLGCDPARVCLQIAEGGKPQLIDGPAFNLSHTGDLALLAVAPFAVGIDVERRRRVTRATAIARRVLDATTVAALAQLTGPTRDEAFLQAWTAMEARQKCLGQGVFGQRVSCTDVGQLAVKPDDAHIAHLAWAPAELTPVLHWLTVLS